MKTILGLAFFSFFMLSVKAAPKEDLSMPIVLSKYYINDYKCPKDITIQTCFAEVIEKNSIDNPCTDVFEAPEGKNGSLWLKIHECGIHECDEGYRVIEGDPNRGFPNCCRRCERVDKVKIYD